jgi:hypothetical protein
LKGNLMSSFQRIRAEAHFAALHRPALAPVAAPVIEPAATANGFDRLRAELAAKRTHAKLRRRVA